MHNESIVSAKEHEMKNKDESVSSLKITSSKKKTVSVKNVITGVVILVLFIGISVAFLPFAKTLMTEEGQASVLEFVDSLGVFGYLIFFVFQVLQIVIAVIPGGPIPLIGGMLFGEWVTLFLSSAGCFVGTVIVYYLVQLAGKPIVNLFVSDEQLRSYRFMQNTKRIEIIVFLVFLCPGLPKDALTYIVSLTPIKPMRLFVLTSVGRLPSMILTIWLGGGIWDKDIKLIIILAVGMVLAAVIGFFIKRKIDSRTKNKKGVI